MSRCRANCTLHVPQLLWVKLAIDDCVTRINRNSPVLSVRLHIKLMPANFSRYTIILFNPLVCVCPPVGGLPVPPPSATPTSSLPRRCPSVPSSLPALPPPPSHQIGSETPTYHGHPSLEDYDSLHSPLLTPSLTHPHHSPLLTSSLTHLHTPPSPTDSKMPTYRTDYDSQSTLIPVRTHTHTLTLSHIYTLTTMI